MYKRAIVRIPGENFFQGLSTGLYGVPDYTKTLAQHMSYCEALRKCGLDLIVLQPDVNFPDSCFVEDTAILTERCAIITNPGADSRKGEIFAIKDALLPFYNNIHSIQAPGTVDGGDICEADGHFFIGLSSRTNREGGQQLADFLVQEGFTASFIDVRGALHLKSGIAYLGDGNMALIDAFADVDEFKKYHILRVASEESPAANCIRVNDYVLMPSGYPDLEQAIQNCGNQVVALDMSEFQKMDGGLSCLSLRF